MEEFVAQYPNTTMDVPAALDEIEDAKNKNRILNSIDYALLGVYSAEAILKVRQICNQSFYDFILMDNLVNRYLSWVLFFTRMPIYEISGTRWI